MAFTKDLLGVFNGFSRVLTASCTNLSSEMRHIVSNSSVLSSVCSSFSSRNDFEDLDFSDYENFDSDLMEDISSFPPPPTPSSPLTSPETGRRGLHTSATLWNNSDRIKKSSGVGVNKMVSFVGFLNVM